MRKNQDTLQAIGYLTEYLESEDLDDVLRAKVYPDYLFPEEYRDRWLEKGWDPDPIGTIGVVFKDGKGPYTYPLRVTQTEGKDLWDGYDPDNSQDGSGWLREEAGEW